MHGICVVMNVRKVMSRVSVGFVFLAEDIILSKVTVPMFIKGARKNFMFVKIVVDGFENCSTIVFYLSS